MNLNPHTSNHNNLVTNLVLNVGFFSQSAVLVVAEPNFRSRIAQPGFEAMLFEQVRCLPGLFRQTLVAASHFFDVVFLVIAVSF